MVDAGIQPVEEVLTAFNNVKMSKTMRFGIFKINEEKKVVFLFLTLQPVQIVVETTGGPESTWDEFVKLLPATEPRFCVFDYPYVTNEKPPRHLSKLLFIGWSPDDSDVKPKMTYASAKMSFKMKLPGISKEVQATDFSYVILQRRFFEFFSLLSLIFKKFFCFIYSWTQKHLKKSSKWNITKL